MIELRFAGWFQCRLATDPDPSDEPRGVSGSTFAFPGEPNLDGVIRFDSTPWPRVPGPPVGVTVRTRGPLYGAPVELLGAARFEGRNGLVGAPGRELIDPLHIRIARDGTFVERADPLVERRRRAGRGVEFDAAALRALHAATGITDFAAHRAARERELHAELERASDPLRRAELRGRLRVLLPIEAVRVHYRLRLGEHGGRGSVSDDLRVDAGASWPLAFWLGAWDPDALCGYCAGVLVLPAA